MGRHSIPDDPEDSGDDAGYEAQPGGYEQASYGYRPEDSRHGHHMDAADDEDGWDDDPSGYRESSGYREAGYPEPDFDTSGRQAQAYHDDVPD